MKKRLNFKLKTSASIDNIYQLDGAVPVHRAIPFGLQHILAMFVANIAPILIVSGAEDPVGGYGKGIDEVMLRLAENGAKNVTKKLYPEMRHEILNEFGRETVYADILSFIQLQNL